MAARIIARAEQVARQTDAVEAERQRRLAIIRAAETPRAVLAAANVDWRAVLAAAE